jgi:UDP-N-acetylglucosamine diphosphorylase/glucosamine-1-phosphate N-acetyltransferase
MKDKVAAVILAAGSGKRMKSDKAKVLHEINDKPMILYVVETANKIAGNNIVVVVGKQADKVIDTVSVEYKVFFALQKEQLGTGDAVKCALPFIPDYSEDILILCGDVPLLSFDTLNGLYEEHMISDRDISILAVESDNPKGYGRIIVDNEKNVSGIIEETDATYAQKRIKIINTGIYCVKKKFLAQSLYQIGSDNAQGEFYFTDIVKIGYKNNKKVGAFIGKDKEEVLGINNIDELHAVERIIRSRLGIIS